MSVARKLLGVFRQIQYRIYGRPFYGVMPAGVPCRVEDRTPEITHGDVVHPCVRYNAEGFEGHHWWMVYTPYYAAKADLENPVLCYADPREGELPTDWKFYCVIRHRPKYGYNSDPTMFFNGGRLFVFWRENATPGTKASQYCRATFGCEVQHGECVPFDQPLLAEPSENEDRETCPTLLPSDDGYLAYAMHLRFFSPSLRYRKGAWGKFLNRCALVGDLLGLYSQQKSYGLAIWKGNSLERPLHYTKTVKFKGVNKLYRPWHIDFFDWDGVRYAIIQTNQSNADICLAKSTDGETFELFKKPLITNRTIDMIGIYKPSAIMIDGQFYLFYTAQSKNDRALNKLFCVRCDFKELMQKI